jgi:NRPS condensation-like uncharacterized protein
MDHYRGENGSLNCPVLFKLRGPLDVAALTTALREVIRRHEALRTSFVGSGRYLEQIVNDPRPISIADFDISRSEDSEAALREAISQEINTRIDLSDLPVRATLWRLGEQDNLFCLNMHHLVTDVWSCGVVSREIGVFYNRETDGGPAPPPVIWQYSQFVAWQEEWLASEALHSYQSYWSKKLQGVRLPAFPASRERLPRDQRRVKFERVHIDRDTMAALQRVARANRATLFTVMLSIYYALLYRLTGETDLATASLVANRFRPEVEHTVGFLSNMIILRTAFEKGANFSEMVRATRSTVIGALTHQELPYQMLPLAAVQKDSVRDIVFQMFASPVHQLTLKGIESIPFPLPDGYGARFDIDLSLIPSDGGFEVLLAYAQDGYGPAWALQFVSGFASMATAVAGDSESPIASLHISI